MTRPRRRFLTHDRRIALLALGAGAVPLAVALVLLWDASSLEGGTRWTLAGVAAGAWALFALAAREAVVRPLQTLSNLLGALREGDFSFRARAGRDHGPLGDALRELNALAQTLREERLGALEATALLQRVMGEIDVAVFAFDGAGRLQLVNRAGEALLGQPTERLVDVEAEKIGFAGILEGESPRVVEASFPGGAGRFEVRLGTFRQGGKPHRLVVLSDVSRALREEERAAWQRLIRVMGHELNNSLAPIKSIAGSLDALVSREPRPADADEDLRRGLSVIASRAESLGRFMDAYSRLARLPAPRRQDVAVEPLVRRVAGMETRVPVAVAGGPAASVRADPDQVEQVLINLLRNAADAALETAGGVSVAWEAPPRGGFVEVRVDDDGPGLTSTANLFVPFFTTKPSGSGIGLVLSRQIAEAHGGSLTLANRAGARGCRASLRLPRSGARASAAGASAARASLLLSVLLSCALVPHPSAAAPAALRPPSSAAVVPSIEASGLRIELTARPGALWRFAPTSSAPDHSFAPPVFPLDGRLVRALPVRFERAGDPIPLGPDVLEQRFRGVLREDPSLSIEVRFRQSDLSPVVRFQYVLTATKPHAFSRAGAEDELAYLETSFEGLPRAREVRLSEFVELFHSYTLSERPVDADDFTAGLGVMGPILVASDGRRTMLLAYEHGSQAPDAFLRFDLGARRVVRLRAVKGSYWRGQVVDAQHPYETVWMQAGLVAGDEERTAEAYRRFVRTELAAEAPLAPRVHYNTWNFQERNKWWNGKRYLDSMDAERMLAEIDVAHRMGIETFVLDTGWYEKTGDWAVSRARFPEGLAPIRKRLDGYGMKLGLWFDPAAAAVSSRAYLENQGNVLSTRGKTQKWPVWETEESYRMCLVSPWGETFLKELVRLAKETGVTYFKWDAVGQYGCDAPGHGHGDASNTNEERRDAYAFRVPLRLAEIARRLGEEVPGALVDFDVTEGGRGVGLAFLTAGRYFLVNNGPYFQNYDVPIDLDRQNWNLFFNKGPARTWITRSTYGYDKWIPSQLFLAHYFPDDPEESQLVNVGSLVLGHDGIWGDLLSVSPEGVARIGKILAMWRQVRDSMMAASPVRVGDVGGSGEVHEKIEHESGRGGIVIFSTHAGRERYVSEHPTLTQHWATPGVTVTFDAGGHAVVDAAFEKPGAAIVFFGAREE
jgi:alpha-galactosidase